MTITSVRLMFATDNRATPFALRGYFMNIFTSRNRHSRGVSPLRKNHMACMKKYKAYIIKICALYFKTNAFYFSFYQISDLQHLIKTVFSPFCDVDYWGKSSSLCRYKKTLHLYCSKQTITIQTCPRRLIFREFGEI